MDMRRVLAVILGIGLGLNALLMLAVPAAWYAAVPGVTQTGPFNPHFVRDIGAAYLVTGAALILFRSQSESPIRSPGRRRLSHPARSRPPVGCGRRSRARPSAPHRPCHRFFAVGAGDLDRVAGAQTLSWRNT